MINLIGIVTWIGVLIAYLCDSSFPEWFAPAAFCNLIALYFFNMLRDLLD